METTIQIQMVLDQITNRLRYLKQKYIGNNTYMVLASIFVGILSGLAAVLLKHFVRFTHHLSDLLLSLSHTTLIYIVSSLAGILLTLLIIKLLFKGKFEKGLVGIFSTIFPLGISRNLCLKANS
ncbi:MAG: hypothetical protein M0P47_12290 [Bacteroidales bacterium]|nr:hypothetical protein [Bacteroidales bacterium]